jgi:hypothetical protein
MTFIASHILVAAFEPELGLVVVKIPDAPVARVMAGFALSPQASFVRILFLMA